MKNEYDHFIETLNHWGEVEWLDTYFNVIRQLLQDLQLQNDSPALAMNVNKNKNLTVNIGQRYVTCPCSDCPEIIGLILPMEADETDLDVDLLGYFKRQKTDDAKFVLCHLPAGQPMPQNLYNAWLEACSKELKKTKKSGFKKHHSTLFFDTVMNDELRTQVLSDVEKLSQTIM